MTYDSVRHYYNEVMKDYGVNSLRRRKVLALAQRQALDHARILDFGCAGGYLSQELKRPQNYVVGVDIAEQSVHAARKVLDEAFVLDVERDVWPDEWHHARPFDLVLCAEFIEHLFDPRAFLRRLHEIIRPDGAVILTTPNFLVWNNRLRILLGRYGPKEVFLDQGHIHLFSYYGIMDVVQEEGFTVMREDHVWYPNWAERLRAFLPPNLFVYQTIIVLCTP